MRLADIRTCSLMDPCHGPGGEWRAVFVYVVTLLMTMSTAGLRNVAGMIEGNISPENSYGSATANRSPPGLAASVTNPADQPPPWCLCQGRCGACGLGWCSRRSQHSYSDRCRCRQCHLEMRDRR